MSDSTREFVDGMMELKMTNIPGYLGVYAILLLPGDSEKTQPPAGYSRNDFKRAIRLLRIYQHSCPEQSEHAESAIALIRRDWLHRGAQYEC